MIATHSDLAMGSFLGTPSNRMYIFKIVKRVIKYMKFGIGWSFLRFILFV